MIGRVSLALLALAGPAAAAAQDPAAADAADMKAIEAKLPKRSWYPDGYYEVRIAAEAEVAEDPDGTEPEPGEPYNLLICDPGEPGFDLADPALRDYGAVALDTARLRAALVARHYPEQLFAAPLAAFERERLADARPRDALYADLAAALDTARAASAPDLPPVVAVETCAPPPPPPPPPPPAATPPPPSAAPPPRPATAVPRRAPGVTFVTQPPAGEVLMISAFAFKVCVLRKPDPWDRFACRWNEIETGAAKPMSGRFVYQVKWPDGTVRKGTREIAPGGSSTVTFRKVGS
jgi:hypothetical protein